MTTVSIIIPALNEAHCIARTLRCLQQLQPPAWEIVVVDGGSQDDTIALAEAAGVRVITATQPSRAVQMNQGASVTTGEVLWFLHADTLVPDDGVAVITQALADPTVVGGGFVSLMAGVATTRWGISLHNYLKTYYAPLLFRPLLFGRGLRLLFGDQAIFCWRSPFEQCGGFNAALPIMEDGDLCLRLVRHGRLRLVNRVVQSSDRRVAKWGALKATAIYLYVGILWGVGVSKAYIKRFYADIR